MTILRFLLLAASACLLATEASARLGDSEAELLKRFGDPIRRSGHMISAQGKSYEMGRRFIFKQDDWTITCIVVDGRCMKIQYGKRGDWTEEQFQLVLSANSQGTAWTETSKASVAKMLRSWKRSDGSIAQWSKPEGSIELTWSAYDRAKAAVETRAKAESSKKPKI